MQVELYCAAQDNKAGVWRHVGDHEQPYYTGVPAPGRKSKTKWVDLLLAEPNPKSPKRIVWVELKDVGRSEHTLKANSVGLGHDLAALYSINPSESKKLWLDPHASRVDKGRVEEWKECTPALDCDDHLIAQVALAPRGFQTEMVVELWHQTFAKRAGVSAGDAKIIIKQSDTNQFAILALVSRLQPRGNKETEHVA